MNLHQAIKQKNINDVKILLSNGANMNEQNSAQYTPLHYSITEKNIDIILLLLNYGADVEIGDERGMNALHYAVFFDLFEIVVKILEKYPLTIHTLDKYGNNALWTAILKPQINYLIVELLLEAGADTKHKNQAGINCLEMAKRKNNEKLIEMLEKSS
jgi:uncharacterized protein